MNTAPLYLLIAEDEAAHVEAIRRGFEGAGTNVEIRAVGTLREFRTSVAERLPDLAVVDLNLPDGQALEILTQPAEDGRFPVLVMTAFGNQEIVVHVMKAGALDYVVKSPEAFTRMPQIVESGMREWKLLQRHKQAEAELVIANKELLFQNEEKEKRAAELVIANKELLFQNEEKEKRAAELVIANKELLFQNEEKEKRAAELDNALDELKRAQSKMLEQERLRIVGQMASGIAHDFNNALAPIVGFTELLLERPEIRQDDAKLTEFLGLMLEAGKDAASVVRRLRELYRKQPDSTELTVVSLNKVAQQAVQLTEPRWRDEANAAGATIHVEINLPSVPGILGCESSLREMLMNLILNAVDALPQGGTIRLKTYTADHSVFVEVSDTGSGMTEEVRQQCFEPFFSTKGPRGTGLGLAMVKGIVHNHGGHTSVASELGKGTTFTLRFPIQALPEKAVPLAKPEVPLLRLRILLVDDEMIVRRVHSELLRRDGHQVEAVDSGPAALAAFARQPFDLVVTDMAMEGMSGEQLAVHIQKLAPGTPIILLTGFGDLIQAREQKVPGVSVVLGKPATLDKLRTAVRKAMQAAPKGAS